MSINPEKFQESITQELEVVKDRVRNLIGNAHWGEEGRYKEVVLMNVIRRFLPSNLSVGTGFIVKNDPGSNGVSVSKQIDIIVYENRIPVLFQEGSFIITTHSNVRVIVEVKTSINNNLMKKTLRKSVINAKMMRNPIFNGIFAYEYNRRNSLSTLKHILEELRENGQFVNHLSLGPYIFAKYWTGEASLVDSAGCPSDFYGIYDFSRRENSIGSKKLSFSYFISNLLYAMSGMQLRDRIWLLFPVVGGKERYRVETACLDRHVQQFSD